MALEFFSGYVQRPSAAPTVDSAASGTLTVAHRRRSLSGASQVSAFVLNVDFPMTLTPEPYSDPDALVHDEILVSSDSGATWTLQSSGTTGTVVLDVFDSGAATVSVGNTQTAGIATLDAGLFSATDSPSLTIYAKNDGPSQVQLLAIDVFDTATLQAFTEFSGHISFGLLGTLATASGSGALNTGQNVSTIWSLDGTSSNSLEFILAPNEVAKLEIGLINFPALGELPASGTIGFSLTPNARLRPIAVASNWPQSSRVIDPLLGYGLELIEGTMTGIRVLPLQLNFFGLALTRRFTQTITITGDATYRLNVQQNGNVSVQLATDPLIQGAVTLAEFDWAAGVVSNVSYLTPLRPAVVTSGTAAGALEIGDWLGYDASAELVASGDARGVCLTDAASGEPIGIALRGKALSKVGAAVVTGDLLSPDASGVAQSGGTDAIALTDAVNGFALVEIF